MMANINQLKWEGHKIRTFEVWYNTRNTELYQQLDMGRCYGHVPYFFNKRTRKFICGPTTIQNLRNWAEDKPCEVFLFPPDYEKPETQDTTVDMNALKKWASEKKYKVEGAAKQRYKALKKDSPEAAKSLEKVEDKVKVAERSVKKNAKEAREKYKEKVAPAMNKQLEKLQTLIARGYEDLRKSSQAS
jgi:hypothetical protein